MRIRILSCTLLLAACADKASTARSEQSNLILVYECNTTGECPDTATMVCIKKPPPKPDDPPPDPDDKEGTCRQSCTTDADCPRNTQVDPPAPGKCISGTSPLGEALRYCANYSPGQPKPLEGIPPIIIN